MRATRPAPRRFADSFNESVEKVGAQVQKFLDSSDAPNTQRLRRATKRLRTAHSVLPKKLRRDPPVREYVAASKRLSTATGRVRDLDTIAAWTSQLTDSKDRRSLASDLEKMRGSTLRGAVLEAKELLKTKTPSIEPERLSRPGLERRVGKVERRLVKKVDKEFEEFLSTQEVEVMHELRKDSKRLRQLLELTQDGNAAPLLDRLRSIQDDLGAIRDHDLVIDYLRSRVRLTSTRFLVREEIAKRHARLEDFVTKNRGQGRVVPVSARQP
jgi:CHAD domain-containing protein